MHRSGLANAVLIVTIALSSGCASRVEPPIVNEILAQPDTSGWWGIGTPTGYDAASYGQICFWAYAQQPNQAFRLKMKDTAGKENGVVTNLEPANQWTEICTDLNKFTDLGIKLNSLENINLGFEQPTGSAEIWVADFKFR